MLTLDNDCPESESSKCEPKSLHITCGYPAANPNNNLNAYCNELKHYFRCAKCKTINCKPEGNILSIRKHLSTQLNNYNQKCVISTTTTTTTSTTTSTTIILPQTETVTFTLIPTETTTTKSKIQQHLDKILKQNSLLKSNTIKSTTTTTSTTNPTIPASTQSNLLLNSTTLSIKQTKLNHLLITFDNIDTRKNTIEVFTPNRGSNLNLKILNRTDIFKGIKSGAVYLHSKTSFILNLMDKSSDFCLTSLAERDLTCSNGWSVNFWIKISYLNLFDKTLLKVDNFVNNKIDHLSKYFLLRVSSYEIKIEFLYKRKLWSVNQNVIWKSEWSMLSFTWSEFDGITVYINGKKLFCQQGFDYYPLNDKSEDILDPIKRSFNYSTGIIYIGLNNKLNKNSRKFYWNYRDQTTSLNQNVNLTSSFSESILLDEMSILNSKIASREISNIYLKEYSIKSEYDSVEEKMYLISTDSRQNEIVPIQGALFRKSKENWFMNLNGEKQLFLIPNLFDSCILDAENLCTFGFSLNIWLRVLYNFRQYPIEKTFEQSLFFIGKQDLRTGLEAFLNILPDSNGKFDFFLIINFKTSKYEISKHFQIFLEDIFQLNNLNCLSIQFTDVNSLNLNLIWLGQVVVEVEAKKAAPNYSLNTLNELKDLGLRSSLLSSSNSIGLIGDALKQSYFSVQNFELKNSDTSLEKLEIDFDSANPSIFEFDSIEKLSKIPSLTIQGQPSIVDSKYGKSILFSSSEQKLIFQNVSDKCFGNLNLCKNGYTLKLWLCFTNYNSNRKIIDTPNMAKKIYIISNGAPGLNEYSFSIYYDLNKGNLVVSLKSVKKIYHCEIGLKMKYFIWYTLTVTWHESDGLRVYINNRLLDHSIGVFYKNLNPFSRNSSSGNLEFIIGKSDFELNDYLADSGSLGSSKIPVNFLDQLENQTEDLEKNRKFLGKNKNYQFLSHNEFIVYKMIQYNVRKYPDEVITRNIIVQEENLRKKSAKPSLYWYTAIVVFASSSGFFY